MGKIIIVLKVLGFFSTVPVQSDKLFFVEISLSALLASLIVQASTVLIDFVL